VAEFTIEERRRKSAERLMSRGAGKRPYSLTAREIEVLGWAARGKSAREIAEILQITKRTVDAHVHSAIGKIDAVNRNNAVAIAIRDRLIDV
jgi:DNA-binding CsgD family transcriptional regulator